MRLYPNFGKLIEQKNQQNGNYGNGSFGYTFIHTGNLDVQKILPSKIYRVSLNTNLRKNQRRMVHFLFLASFASMLNVACGTARNRSFGINLPVSRQIP